MRPALWAGLMEVEAEEKLLPSEDETTTPNNNMPIRINNAPCSRLTVTEVGEFLRKPPVGFTVERLQSGYRVRSPAEDSLVLIDDFESGTHGGISFRQSVGRAVKMHNLWEYSSTRRSLLSKRIYFVTSVCEGQPSARGATVLRQFVVSLNGSDPFIRWQMEKGLDWTLSSVAGESYKVDVDLTDALETWAEESQVLKDLIGVKTVWRNASFTLKYYSDALFDFPHWFGFSKRSFKVRLR